MLPAWQLPRGQLWDPNHPSDPSRSRSRRIQAKHPTCSPTCVQAPLWPRQAPEPMTVHVQVCDRLETKRTGVSQSLMSTDLGQEAATRTQSQAQLLGHVPLTLGHGHSHGHSFTSAELLSRVSGSSAESP